MGAHAAGLNVVNVAVVTPLVVLEVLLPSVVEPSLKVIVMTDFPCRGLNVVINRRERHRLPVHGKGS